ncbi:hypothetical protein HK107_14700 [Parvularcula sp. ZS-1/3]|uniref:Uncharacterized protein n=1 Tax=Parvularcula mediterranea TaxID=2732508 RepID=A0A7Y3RNY9_9PROT|nr:hypothetical protein [Parvularcula mediterranea]NNU17578.1 hypothetical protein [Parvularcula mediterranea]
MSTFWEVREAIAECISQFRFVEAELSAKTRSRLFGALDALRDANSAVRAYPDAITNAPSSGVLACYGFLQALYVMQDAVKCLSESLGVKFDPHANPDTAILRSARNVSVGHPALSFRHVDGRKHDASGIILHDSITEEGFAVYVYSQVDGGQFDVSYETSIDNSERVLGYQLLRLYRELIRREKSHANRLIALDLRGKFEKGAGYLCEKLFCDLRDGSRTVQARLHLKMIREQIGGMVELSGKALKGALQRTEAISVIKATRQIEKMLMTPECQEIFWVACVGLRQEFKALVEHCVCIDRSARNFLSSDWARNRAKRRAFKELQTRPVVEIVTGVLRSDYHRA